MSHSIKLVGNLLIQLATGATPTPVPVGVDTVYNEKLIYEFNYTASQTNTPVPAGSVTNPRWVIVFVDEGTISLSWDSSGDAPTVLTASSISANKPVMILFRDTAPAGSLYITTTAPARGQIWLLE